MPFFSIAKSSICRSFPSFVAVSFLLFPFDALSENDAKKQPWIDVKVPMELQNDYDYASGIAGNERNNLTVTLEPQATLNVLPVPGLSIFAHADLEQVADAEPGEDRYFDDHGFYIEELLLRYERGPFVFRGGKTNPGFGIAWDKAPGIYGTDMAEDYEEAERIVLSGTAKGDFGPWGVHAVTAGTFFLDTSPLQHTIYSRSRGTLDHADGGSSNTDDFSSFNVTLDGGAFAVTPALEYHLGFIHQAHGVDGTRDEKGYVVGLTNRFELGSDIAITPLAEFVRLEDAGGTKDKKQTYWTLSFLNEWKSWNLALATTHRRTTEPGTVRASDYQYQVSLGYAFDFGLTADVGWKRLKESGTITDRVGLFFTYEFGLRR